MYLEAEIPQKQYNKIFRVKKSSKNVSLLLLDAKVLQERCDQRF